MCHFLNRAAYLFLVCYSALISASFSCIVHSNPQLSDCLSQGLPKSETKFLIFQISKGKLLTSAKNSPWQSSKKKGPIQFQLTPALIHARPSQLVKNQLQELDNKKHEIGTNPWLKFFCFGKYSFYVTEHEFLRTLKRHTLRLMAVFKGCNR